jgi:hypothetical protein
MPADVRRALRRAGVITISALAITRAAGAQQLPASPAASPTVALEWLGPGPEDTCLGRDRLANAVEDYLGRPAFAVEGGETTLSVRVESRGQQGYRALLLLRETATGRVLGNRELTTPLQLCSGLDDALTLTVALMVDDDWSGAAEASAAPPEPTPPAEVSPPPPPKPSKPWGFGVEALVLVGMGALPKTAAGAELGFVALPVSWLALRAHARGFLPSSLSAGSAELEMTLFGAGASLCPTATLGAGWSLAGCVGGEGGLLFANPRGFEASQEHTSSWFGAAFAGRLQFRPGRHFGLVGQAELVAPFKPERFVADLDDERELLFQMDTPFWVFGLGGAAWF